MNLNEYTIFSLSHIDLDGYASQFLLKENLETKIHYYNSNYGNEIDKVLSNMFKKMKYIKEKKLLIITDLNLTTSQCLSLDNLRNDNFEIILIDHHITGKSSSEKFEWYFLNPNYCSTYLVNQFLKENNLITKENQYFYDKFSSFVNSTDLYIENDIDFNKANYLSDIVFNDKIVNNIDTVLNFKYKMYMIRSLSKQFIIENKTLSDVENYIYKTKEKFILNTLETDSLNDFLKSINPNNIENIQSDISSSHKLTYLFYKHCDTSKYSIIKNGRNLNYILYFNIGSSSYQKISNWYLNDNENIDFAIHINYGGTLSFRTKKDNIDLAILSSKLFNGGGHQKASGGRLDLNGIKLKNKEDAMAFVSNKIENYI